MESQTFKNAKNQTAGDQDIDIIVLIKSLLKKWWLIFLAAALVGTCSLLYARFLVKPTYQAKFTAYVNNKQSKYGNDSLTNSDILASQELVRTYSKILTSNTVLMKAADLLGDDYSYATLAKMVKTQAEDDTEIISVLVTAGSKEEAYKIASAIEAISPDCMAEIIEGSSMKVVDTTQVPGTRNSPSYTKFSVIGALIGGVIMAGILTVKFFTNDTVNDDAELEKRYSVPVVGIIPLISKSSSEHGGYYGYYGHYGYGASRKQKNADPKETGNSETAEQ